MIKLDISIAIFLYLLFSVVIVFILWIFLDRKSKTENFKVDRKNIYQCEICKYVFIDQKNEDFTRCPRCKNINKKGVQKK